MIKKKRCYRCKQTKLLEDFAKSKNRKDGRNSLCKECKRKAWPEYRDKNRDRLKEYRLMYRDRSKEYRRIHREELRKASKEYNRKKHLKALQKVSGLEKPICVNCGCDDLRLLEINHINGAKIAKIDRKEKGGMYGFYVRILEGKRKTNDLNVLCRLCNVLHYIQIRYGNIPMKIIWKGSEKE